MALQVKSKKNGNTYFLHGVVTANKTNMFYYFSRQIKVEREVNVIPHGYELDESPQTGLPVLRKVKRQATAV